MFKAQSYACWAFRYSNMMLLSVCSNVVSYCIILWCLWNIILYHIVMLVKYHTVSYCDAPLVRYFWLKITLLWTQQLCSVESEQQLGRPLRIGSPAKRGWAVSIMARIILISIMAILLIIIFSILILTLIISVFSHLWDINATGKASVCCLNNTDSPLSITVQLDCSKFGQNFLDLKHSDVQIQIHKYANTNTNSQILHPGAVLVMRPIQSAQFGFYRHYCMHTNTRQWCSLSRGGMRMKNDRPY